LRLKLGQSLCEGWGANDEVVADLRNTGVNDEKFVEILTHIGINLFANYFNNVVQTEIDFPLVQSQKKAA